MIQLKGISGGYPGFRVLNDLSFSVESGQLFGILGPNGSGKTTLLKMISGLIAPVEGEILIKERPIQMYSPKELARVVAVLPQVSSEVFSYTVKETVSLGRYAHQSGWLRSESIEDEKIVCEAMNMTGIATFQTKLLQELSGGERQRVFLAQALAQQPEILLLDEPTNHLDLSFQKELLDQLKKWTRERGLAVISIFHDLNLASLYCDKLLLLHAGKINITGAANDIFQKSRIEDVYRTKIEKQPHPKVPKPQLALLPETGDNENIDINESMLKINEKTAELQSPISLKVMSSSSIGAGMGWRNKFIYYFENNKTDNSIQDCIVGMRAYSQEKLRFGTYSGDGFSILMVVAFNFTQESLNLWLIVNGEIIEKDFIHALTVATEVVVDCGESVDEIMIAATGSNKVIDREKLQSLIQKGLTEKIKEMKV